MKKFIEVFTNSNGAEELKIVNTKKEVDNIFNDWIEEDGATIIVVDFNKRKIKTYIY